MTYPTLGDLLELIAVRVTEAEGAIRRVYEWRHERALTASRGLLGASAAIFLGLLIAYLKGEFTEPLWKVAIASLGSLVLAGFGAMYLRAVARIDREYFATLTILSALRRALTQQ